MNTPIKFSPFGLLIIFSTHAVSGYNHAQCIVCRRIGLHLSAAVREKSPGFSPKRPSHRGLGRATEIEVSRGSTLHDQVL